MPSTSESIRCIAIADKIPCNWKYLSGKYCEKMLGDHPIINHSGNVEHYYVRPDKWMCGQSSLIRVREDRFHALHDAVFNHKIIPGIPCPDCNGNYTLVVLMGQHETTEKSIPIDQTRYEIRICKSCVLTPGWMAL